MIIVAHNAGVEQENLPLSLDVEFRSENRFVRVYVQGAPVGDILSDNSHEEDFFRYHDVFHFANAMVLGWSPCTRKLLGRKRRSSAYIDEIEDGGRASIVEEAVVSIMHKYVRGKIKLQGAIEVIKILVEGYEPERFCDKDWKQVIDLASKIYPVLIKNKGGRVVGDRLSRTLYLLNPEAI
ncbi:MAG: hypothetical protein AB7T49_03655 [Oligoflexales bacterium]